MPGPASTAILGDDVAVISPHLDDAVLSLGASLFRAVRTGTRVRVITVFAGDPSADFPAGQWDRGSGFSTAGEAARARQAEDRAACRILGAEPVWLPFWDEQYKRTQDDTAIWAATTDAVGQTPVVLIPGFPLVHRDHARVSCLLLARGLAASRVALYVEQPYTQMYTSGRPETPEPLREQSVPAELRWVALPARHADWIAKARAYRAYPSQRKWLGRWLMWRVTVHERRRGGERVAWLYGPARSGATPQKPFDPT